MLFSWAVRVVLFPSGVSHLPLNTPPTPVAKGVTTWSFGLVSLKGVPKKPQTTGAVTPGGAGAWIWATVRLSFGSAVWDPVTSMLKMVAVKVMAVRASFSTKFAVPKEAGRGASVAVVGLVGGTS